MIGDTVGEGGANQAADVKFVQILLNLALAGVADAPRLAASGSVDAATLAAIEIFQRIVMGLRTANRRLGPTGRTLRWLQQAVPAELRPETLHAILLGADTATIERFFEPLSQRMRAHSITLPLRIAHFLAQVGHESSDLHALEDAASGETNEGRCDLGNFQPGDGSRFKGRGLLRLTGRAQYRRYALVSGYDVVSQPQRVASEPQIAADAACWLWSTTGLNALADVDDVQRITRRLAGGPCGLADRSLRLKRAKWLLLG